MTIIVSKKTLLYLISQHHFCSPALKSPTNKKSRPDKPGLLF